MYANALKIFSRLRGLTPCPAGGDFAWINCLTCDINYFTDSNGYTDTERMAIDALEINEKCVLADDHIVIRDI